MLKKLLFSFLVWEIFGHFCTFNSKNGYIPIGGGILTYKKEFEAAVKKAEKYLNKRRVKAKISDSKNILPLLAEIKKIGDGIFSVLEQVLKECEEYFNPWNVGYSSMDKLLDSKKPTLDKLAESSTELAGKIDRLLSLLQRI